MGGRPGRTLSRTALAGAVKIAWWKWLPLQGWRTVGQAEHADEVPERLPRNGVVLIGDPERLKWVVFDCPCRTGHRIMLNADPGRKPRWILKGLSPVTISPSIDYRGSNRRCHYFIRNGRVQWAGDSDR